MADHGQQFSVSLQQMADDLHELATNIERGRKQWKQTGLSAEKRVVDAESSAEKAKAKYDNLAEQYDRVKTGDKQSGKFGLKGPKSAAQHEEELLRKVQNADGDYASKVQAAQAARQELVSTHRPQAVFNIQQLIAECDSGLSLQLQKFGMSASDSWYIAVLTFIATFNEKLLLGQGLSISPLKDAASSGAVGPRSLYDVIGQIDNQKDFQDFVLSHEGNPGAVASEEVKYERHPVCLTPAVLCSATHVLDTCNQYWTCCSRVPDQCAKAPVFDTTSVILSAANQLAASFSTATKSRVTSPSVSAPAGVILISACATPISSYFRASTT